MSPAKEAWCTNHWDTREFPAWDIFNWKQRLVVYLMVDVDLQCIHTCVLVGLDIFCRDIIFLHSSPKSGLELGWNNLVTLDAKLKNSPEGLRLNASLRERCLAWRGLALTTLLQITLLSRVAQGSLRLSPLFSAPHGTPPNIQAFTVICSPLEASLL